MSRENKFRVWDNLSKTMEHNPYITIDVNIIKAIKGKVKIWLNQWLNEPTPDCEKQDEYLGKIVEQYTGLKDKNGKEIYEGDIINTCCGKAKVYFDEESCSYKIWMKHGSTMPLIGKKSHRHLEYEVIGNVHEPIDKSNQVC